MNTPSEITAILQAVEKSVTTPSETTGYFGNVPTLSDRNLLKAGSVQDRDVPRRGRTISVVTQVEQERAKHARRESRDATTAPVRSCGDKVAGLLSGMRRRVKRGFENLWREALSDRALSGSPMHIKAAILSQTLLPQGLTSTAQVTPAPGVYAGGQPPGVAQPQPTPGVQTGGSLLQPTNKPIAGQGVQPTGLDAQPGEQAQKAVMPGVPGHAATNVIDRQGGLDPRGMTVDGNNAAGVPKGFKMAALGLNTGGESRESLSVNKELALMRALGQYPPPGEYTGDQARDLVREQELALMRALGQYPTPGERTGGQALFAASTKQAAPTPGDRTGGSSRDIPNHIKQATPGPDTGGCSIRLPNPFRATPGPGTGGNTPEAGYESQDPGGLLKALGEDFDSYMKQAALGLNTGGKCVGPQQTVNRNQNPLPGDCTGGADRAGDRTKRAAVEPLPRWVSPPSKPLNQELLNSPGVQHLLGALGMKSTPDGDIVDVAGNK